MYEVKERKFVGELRERMGEHGVLNIRIKEEL